MSNSDTGYKESEKKVKYQSVYDFAVNSASDFAEDIDNALIYVEYDGNTDSYTLADYKQQGPNNEVYLTPGSGIAFELVGYNEGDTVQVSMKTIGGDVTLPFDVVESLDETSTEMYYNVTPKQIEGTDRWYVEIITDVSSEGILSLGNVKVKETISCVASRDLVDYILDKNVEADFVPQTFTAQAPAEITKSKNSSISVKTSTDATKVKVVVDDTTETVVEPYNKKAVENGKTDLYNYMYALKGKKLAVGTHTFKLYAISANDETKLSAPITVTVEVTE